MFNMENEDGRREQGLAVTAPTTADAQCVRICELGQQPRSITLPEGSRVSLQELIARGFVAPPAMGVQYFINSRQTDDLSQQVANGDAIVAVKRIVAG
jgi:hypothetical protein